jgi:hypothetical protein
MHTYKHIEKNGVIPEFWAVGYFVRNEKRIGDIMSVVDEWVRLSKHVSERGAIQRVNALNGGDGMPHCFL